MSTGRSPRGSTSCRRARARALLDYLYAHQENPHFQCRFRWTPNAVAMCDNDCAQHLAIWDYYPNVRHGLRVSIVGERPA